MLNFSKGTFFYRFNSFFLEDISPFCEVTGTPVFGMQVMPTLGFKARMDPYIASIQWIPQIYLWSHTCLPLDIQHCGRAIFIHSLFHVLVGLELGCGTLTVWATPVWLRLIDKNWDDVTQRMTIWDVTLRITYVNTSCTHLQFLIYTMYILNPTLSVVNSWNVSG